MLLLVDGIDEWTNENAARIALNKLQVFINQRSIPAVVASRPHGFVRLGMEEAGGRSRNFADLTPSATAERGSYLARLSFATVHEDPLSPEQIDRQSRSR